MVRRASASQTQEIPWTDARRASARIRCPVDLGGTRITRSHGAVWMGCVAEPMPNECVLENLSANEVKVAH